MSDTLTTPQQDPPAQDTVRQLTRDYVERVRGGDVGSLPAILGLVVLVLVFSALRPDTFTNSFNFANLINQSAGVMVIAMGLVFVLLLGEIDLSAGFTAGTAAAVTGIVMTRHGVNWFPSVLVGIATGAFIGLCIGLLVARLGIPSFVVTLATFLGLQGVMLLLIGEGGTIPYRDETVLGLMNSELPLWLGWSLCVLGVATYALVTFRRSRSRRAAGLHGDPFALWAIKTGSLAAILVAATAYLSIERSRNPVAVSLKGVPVVVVVLAVLLIVLTFMLSRTAWGRHVYAVGGNAEAARRAGINVARIKVSCFVLCSSLAAVAGLLLASRDNSVSPSTGGASTLLYAVGAAVIGGTSLFGGKGRPADAVIGGLVVAVINNGMLMLNQPSGRVYVVTGLVLLLAASVDAISRRKAVASGGLDPVARGTGLGHEELRRNNMSQLLTRVHVSGPTSRAALTQELGLNRSTIGDLAGSLAALGLVSESQAVVPGRSGRPSLVVAARTDNVVVAVDIGVDRIAVAMVALGGEVLERRERPHQRGEHDVEHVVESVTQMVTDLLSGYDGARCLGVGVAVPGTISSDDGVVRFAPNLGWVDAPLSQMLTERFGIPVRVANDANLGVLAEQVRGSARGHDDVAYLSGSVGIGGGFLVGGRLLTGAHGYAGEIGHILVDGNGPRCRCGNIGCWEMKVGENQLLTRAGRLPGGGPVGVAEVIAAAAAGEQRAHDAVNDVADWIGVGLRAVINLFNPEVIVLGGALAQVWQAQGDRINAVLDRWSLMSPRREVIVRASQFEQDSPLLGAAEMAFEPLLTNPMYLRPEPLASGA